MYQAIETHFVGASNLKGSRYVARAEAGRVIIGADDALNYEDNHRKAAETLANKFGWLKGFHLEGGATKRGYCFVLVADLSINRAENNLRP